MTLQAAIFITLSFLFPVTIAKAGETRFLLSPEQILQQEIELSAIVINIHRLQLDFLDQNAREELQATKHTLNLSLHALPSHTSDPEARELLTYLLSLWPVVSRHITWLSTLPARGEGPDVQSLLRVLAKMERQLLLLRQKVSSAKPEGFRKLIFLEQALLMRHMTKDYLGLMIARQNSEVPRTSQMQLKELTGRFHQRMTAFYDELSNHPHAMEPMQQAYSTWSFIRNRFEQFPEQQTPDLMVRFSNRIVSKLSSVHRMLR